MKYTAVVTVLTLLTVGCGIRTSNYRADNIWTRSLRKPEMYSAAKPKQDRLIAKVDLSEDKPFSDLAKEVGVLFQTTPIRGFEAAKGHCLFFYKWFDNERMYQLSRFYFYDQGTTTTDLTIYRSDTN